MKQTRKKMFSMIKSCKYRNLLIALVGCTIMAIVIRLIIYYMWFPPVFLGISSVNWAPDGTKVLIEDGEYQKYVRYMTCAEEKREYIPVLNQVSSVTANQVADPDYNIYDSWKQDLVEPNILVKAIVCDVRNLKVVRTPHQPEYHSIADIKIEKVYFDLGNKVNVNEHISVYACTSEVWEKTPCFRKGKTVYVSLADSATLSAGFNGMILEYVKTNSEYCTISPWIIEGDNAYIPPGLFSDIECDVIIGFCELQSRNVDEFEKRLEVFFANEVLPLWEERGLLRWKW